MYKGKLLAKAAQVIIPECANNLPPQQCAICGEITSQWVSNSEVIKSTTGKIADTFRGEQTCVWCAGCFAESKFLAGGIIATPSKLYKPLAKPDAEAGRPSWRNILRALPEGEQTLAIITTNTKRRLWPRGVVSAYANQWKVLFVDGDDDRYLTISRRELLQCLSFVESIYAIGFSKQAILTGLYSQLKLCFEIGMGNARHYEAQLAEWRQNDALLVAVFAAQREE